MAVTTEYSTEYAAIVNKVGLPLDNRDMHSKLRILKFTFTQGAAAGDVASFQYLTKLPAGKINVIADLCKLYHSALDTGVTLDVGFEAYVEPDGTEVSAVVDQFLDGDDVAAAGNVLLVGDAVAGLHQFHSKSGVVIKATNGVAVIPIGATLKGYFVYTID